MTTPPIDRRMFLIGAGLAAVAVACSSSDDSEVEAGDEGDGHMHEEEPTGDSPLVVQVASQDLGVGDDQRFAFGVLRQAGDGYELVRGERVRIGFGRIDGGPGPFQAAKFHSEGLPTDRGFYTTTVSLGGPGTWQATVRVGDLEATAAFEVVEDSVAPSVGDRAIAVATPTTEEKAGVDPICTRDPQCPFHDVSLDKALEGELPVIVLFSTPAYCVSRLCGPVLDNLIELSRDFRNKAEFIHVEIYTDRSTTQQAPGVEAWKLQSEPWMAAIDERGLLVARLDGAFDASEMREAIAKAAGEPASASTVVTSSSTTTSTTP